MGLGSDPYILFSSYGPGQCLSYSDVLLKFCFLVKDLDNALFLFCFLDVDQDQDKDIQ